jgi:hypothetical protein
VTCIQCKAPTYKWTRIWVMVSKKGRNSFSNNTNMIPTSFLSLTIVVGSIILAHNFLNTQLKQMMAILQPFAIKCHMHNGKMSYIITLKSLEIIILLNLFLQWKHIMNESFQVYNDLHEPPFFLICQNI